MSHRLLSSESVTSGHPDKLCDAISDSILDACLRVDPNARVAVETLVKGTDAQSHIVLAGEVTLDGDAPDYASVARAAAAAIGYTDHAIGMDATSEERCTLTTHITTQAAHIAQGVNQGDLSQGAGDQGLMFGFACDETEAHADLEGLWMPLPLTLAQRLTQRLTDVRESGLLPWVRPDGKSQVTVAYDETGTPLSVPTIVIAVQHAQDLLHEFDGDIDAEQAHVKQAILESVIRPVIPASLVPEDMTVIVNGTGRFADPGGPHADAGLTGRKIIVDNYGGSGRVGGGAFSGKDPSKVDRSAAYGARWAAKHIVASGLARRCEIQLAYVIGVADPVSIQVNTFGTGTHSDEAIQARLVEAVSFRPRAMIERLDLLRPIYAITAAGGHFGRHPVNGTFPWEALDAELLAHLSF